MAYQNRIDPARLVFIDETWTKTNMAGSVQNLSHFWSVACSG
jgi:hypothetical protein